MIDEAFRLPATSRYAENLFTYEGKYLRIDGVREWPGYPFLHGTILTSFQVKKYADTARRNTFHPSAFRHSPFAIWHPPSSLKQKGPHECAGLFA